MKFILCNSVSSEGIDKWTQQLLEGRHRHDVLEGYLREIEEDERIDSVGYGGFPNILGEMELDASCMNGDNRVVGAVAAVKNFLPIRIARRLMEKGPHSRRRNPQRVTQKGSKHQTQEDADNLTAKRTGFILARNSS